MSGTTNGNERDRGDQWVETLLVGAGTSLGRVLDGQQRHAVSLALEVFAYMLASLRYETIDVGDVLRYMRYFVKGVLNAQNW